MINRAIQAAIADLDDRGKEDGKARVVTIEVSMAMTQGTAYVDISAKAKLPARRSKLTEIGFMEKGGKISANFRDDNAERLDQPAAIYDAASEPEDDDEDDDGEVPND